MRAPQSERNITADLPVITADILERLRERRPRVHCITNAVAQHFTANVLLAAGAIPSMTISADEIGAFVAREYQVWQDVARRKISPIYYFT